MAIGERFELEKDEELRIEVELLNKEEHIFVELLTGLGEIFATEMVIGTKYKFNQGETGVSNTGIWDSIPIPSIFGWFYRY
jgi:hypothetical protein